MAPVRRPRTGRPQPGGRGASRAVPATRGAALRSARARGSVRRERPRARPGRSDRPLAGLTTRAALLGLVLCGLLVSAAVPTREFLAQRGQITALEQDQADQRGRVVALEERRRQLQDPAHVAAQARARLHYVRPGETAYRVLAPPEPAEPAEGGAPALRGAEAPWYSRLLQSVREADRGGP